MMRIGTQHHGATLKIRIREHSIQPIGGNVHVAAKLHPLRRPHPALLLLALTIEPDDPTRG
jgi:hypothetical protein